MEIRYRTLPRLPHLVVVVWLTGVSSCVAADDVVTLVRLQPPGTMQRRGTIVDYTGEGITLSLPGDRQETIPASRVAGYETALVADHVTGDELFAQDRFAEAVVRYRRAVEQESRTWLRRIILAQMVRCYSNLNQQERAGDTFRVILRSDPSTQLLDALPLAWSSSQLPADMLEPATRWLELEDEPLVSLMGASWLFSSPRRERAVEVLARLARSGDRRTAQLAEAQQWRGRLVTATAKEIDGWHRQLAEMDESLRAGPYFLIGLGWARQGRHQPAALALMRVPVLFPEQEDLAAEALLAAGQQLEKLGDQAAAQSVYRELIRTCQDHRLVPVAQQRLERAKGE